MNTDTTINPDLIRTALQIADTAVICDIESNGLPIGKCSERRWDISGMLDPREQPAVCIDMAEQAIGYGVARGLLELDTTRRWTVRIVRELKA